MPVESAADDVVLLDFADEESVVQTRFATSALCFLRASLGPVSHLAEDAAAALQIDIEPLLGAEQVTYLGTGWTVGLAHEAASKTREAAQLWAECDPAMEYRHGPIAGAEPGRLVWLLGEPVEGLAEDIEATGAQLVHHAALDPPAQLVVAQRFAAARAQRRGLDADRPRHLTRSVVLPAPTG